MDTKAVLKKLEEDEHYYGKFGKQYLSNSDISTLLINSSVSASIVSASIVTATSIDTGQGLNQLYEMNQNVTTTSSPTFNNIIASGEISGSTSIHTKNFVELYSTLGTGGSTSIDLTSANNFEYTVNATSTISFTNSPTAPKAFGFTLVLNNGGSQAITWPTGTLWAGGIAPALTASGTDILVFYTYDGGVSYYGFLTAVNLS